MSHYYITTTLPYVNADPHIGFALEIIQADMLARYARLKGDEVIFNTGTDEHGQKIYKKAIEASLDPQAYCDAYAAKFHELRELLNLTYTNFIRTTDEHHVEAAQEFWRRCEASGDIYKAAYSTKYCVGCELDKTGSELVDGRCPVHPKMEIELRDEENYFFRWSKYGEKLLQHYSDNPDFVMPPEKFNEIKNFVKGGLHDFSISRIKEKMPWGIPVPGDEAHVMYVWFDALVNYISTLGWPSSDETADGVPDAFRQYWPGVQVAGVDNLRQQSAMWQAMLFSAGLPASKQIFIHGFITVDGHKMSKSLGNVIDPKSLVETYGADAVRYYLLREMPYGTDGDYSTLRMEERYAELANNLGNLVSRVAAMADKYCGGKLDKLDFAAEAQGYNVRLAEAIEIYNFREYIDVVWSVVKLANEKVDLEAPFKLAKTDLQAAKKSLSELAAMIRWVGEALLPVIPNAAEDIGRRYNGDTIIVGDPLFPRRDQPTA